jgi:predicted AAA+ superfamily ATPase
MIPLLPRYAASRVRDLLKAFPVVVITGARQVGKTTLAQMLIAEVGGRYVTLEDRGTLQQALADPDGLLVGGAEPLVIDEVQVAPDLLRAVKLNVDRDRRPGRFVLTGSANLLRMASVTESLAGRAAWVELGPLLAAEAARRPLVGVVDRAFEAGSAREFLGEVDAPAPGHVELLRERAVSGGMPGTLGMDAATRAEWYEAYRAGFVERDLRQLSRLEDLPGFDRVFSLTMPRTATLLNARDLSVDADVPYQTTRRYVDVLKVGYQLVEHPAYRVNAHKRLRKRPKLYAGEVGMAAHAMRVRSWDEAVRTARAGALFETLVAGELRVLAGLSDAKPTMLHWRTSSGTEVDVVMERAERVVGIEIKSSSNVSSRDLRGLQTLRDDAGDRFALGILAYTGESAQAYSDRVCVVPAASLLGLTR